MMINHLNGVRYKYTVVVVSLTEGETIHWFKSFEEAQTFYGQVATQAKTNMNLLEVQITKVVRRLLFKDSK